jgi:hypothetical protein
MRSQSFCQQSANGRKGASFVSPAPGKESPAGRARGGRIEGPSSLAGRQLLARWRSLARTAGTFSPHDRRQCVGRHLRGMTRRALRPTALQGACEMVLMNAQAPTCPYRARALAAWPSEWVFLARLVSFRVLADRLWPKPASATSVLRVAFPGRGGLLRRRGACRGRPRCRSLAADPAAFAR